MPIQLKPMTVAPGNAQAMLEAQRQQAMADALKSRALGSRVPQQTGPVAVQMGLGEGLAQLGEALMARRAQKRADKSLANATEQASTARAKALAQLLNPQTQTPGSIPPDDPNEQTVLRPPQSRSYEQLLADSLAASEAGVPQEVIKPYLEANKPPEPYTLSAGQTRFGADNKPLANLPDVQKPTDDIAEYEYAKRNGYPGSLEQWILSSKRAGASQVNVNTEKSLYGTLADNQAKQYSELYSQAQNAPSAIERATRIRELLKTVPYTGAAADFKLAFGKGAKAIGFDYGGDDIQNTELLARELGQNALDAVKSSGLAGSQGLTEGERKFLMQVVGGTINLDANTLARVADLNERMARNSASKWNSTASRLDPNQLRTLGMVAIDLPNAQSPTTAGGYPKKGEVVDGYEFMGGDPANQKNWQKR